MKKFSKILLVVLCAVLLVVGSVLGTLAYLQDDDSNVNTFTSGHVYIDLTEAKIDVDGKSVVAGERVKANTYELIPGRVLTKDPTVTLKAKSEESYVYMVVTVDKIDDLEAALPSYIAADGVFLLQNLVDWTEASKWDYVGYEEVGTAAKYLFVYNTTVSTKNSEDDMDLDPLFSTISIPGDDVTNDNIDTLAGVTINVDAYAIQAEGFGSAAEAWGAGFSGFESATWPN